MFFSPNAHPGKGKEMVKCQSLFRTLYEIIASKIDVSYV